MLRTLGEELGGGRRESGPVAPALERLPEIEVGTGDLEVERERGAGRRLCLGVAPARQQHAGQRGAGRQRIRLQADRLAIRLLGVREPSLLRAHLAEVAARAHVVGLEADGARERGLRLRVAALPVERHPEPSVERGMFGDGERLAVGGLRLRVAALAAEAEREVGARADVGRFDAHGLAQDGLRVGVAALAADRDAKLVEQVAVVGTLRDRATQRRLRLRVAAQRAEGQPASGVQVGVVGTQPQRGLVDLGLLGPASPASQAARERDVRGHERRASLERLAQRDQSLVVPSLTLEGHAEVMPGARVVGRHA